MENKFEYKHRGRLGPCEKDDKSIRILNRVVSWDGEGIKYEADQRHAEVIAQQMKVTYKQCLSHRGLSPATRRTKRMMMNYWDVRKPPCIEQRLHGEITWHKTGVTSSTR